MESNLGHPVFDTIYGKKWSLFFDIFYDIISIALFLELCFILSKFTFRTLNLGIHLKNVFINSLVIINKTRN